MVNLYVVFIAVCLPIPIYGSERSHRQTSWFETKRGRADDLDSSSHTATFIPDVEVSRTQFTHPREGDEHGGTVTHIGFQLAQPQQERESVGNTGTYISPLSISTIALCTCTDPA